MIAVAGGSAVGRALKYALRRRATEEQRQQQQQQQEEGAQQQQHQEEDGAQHAVWRPLLRLRPHIAHQLPAAFELSSQSVALCGLDLPSLLPDTAALPPLVLMPALAEDLQAARRAVGAGGTRGAGAARWALKRCLRAAFELAQPAAGAYTRDLFWCAELAAGALPRQAAALRAALELYVTLFGAQPQQLPPAVDGSSSSGSGDSSSGGSGSSGGGDQQLEQQVAAAWQLVKDLSGKLEGEFLRAMLRPDPGWLTHHYHTSSPGSSGQGASGGGGEGGGRSLWGWLQPQKAAASSAREDGTQLPSIMVPITAQVRIGVAEAMTVVLLLINSDPTLSPPATDATARPS